MRCMQPCTRTHKHARRDRHIHTHKQTIKVNHFLLTSKLKLSVPRRIALPQSCVFMTASSQCYEMQTRPEGHYCLPPNHYQLFALINHSLHPLGLFSPPLCFWWFINTCALHTWLNKMSPRLLA